MLIAVFVIALLICGFYCFEFWLCATALAEYIKENCRIPDGKEIRQYMEKLFERKFRKQR